MFNKSRSRAVSRRLALAAPLALPIAMSAAASEAPSKAVPSVDDVELSRLLQQAEKASSAFMRGDMDAYLKLIRHAPDFTLMQPFGGPFSKGFDRSPEHLQQLADYFQDGETKMELVQAYASGDLAFLAVIEWQHGKVGGLPDQEWPLRVTLVFRRDGTDWLLLHRHADPLVHKITLEQLSALAKG